MGKKKLYVWDVDGPLTNYVRYKKALVEYYKWFLKIALFTEDDYKIILSHNYYEGIKRVCEKHAVANPYEHHNLVDQRENEKRLNLVQDARIKAGACPGIDVVLRAMREQENVLLAINSSAPTNLVLSSIGNLIFEFQYMGVGNNDSDEDVLDHYDGIKRLRSRSKVTKLKWIQEDADVSLEGIVFFTDTIGDVKDAVRFGLSPSQIVCITWGVHSREDFELLQGKHQEYRGLLIADKPEGILRVI